MFINITYEAMTMSNHYPKPVEYKNNSATLKVPENKAVSNGIRSSSPLPPSTKNLSKTYSSPKKFSRPVTAAPLSQYGRGRHVFAPQGYWGGYELMISDEPYTQRRLGNAVPAEVLQQRGSRSQQRSTLDLSLPSVNGVNMNGLVNSAERLPKPARPTFEYIQEQWPPPSETHFTFSGGLYTPQPCPSPRPSPAKNQQISQIHLGEDQGGPAPGKFYAGTTSMETYGVKQLTPRHVMQTASQMNMERNRSSGGIQSALFYPSSLLISRRLYIDNQPETAGHPANSNPKSEYVTTYARDHKPHDKTLYRSTAVDLKAKARKNLSGVWEGPQHRPFTANVNFRRTSGNRMLFSNRREQHQGLTVQTLTLN